MQAAEVPLPVAPPTISRPGAESIHLSTIEFYTELGNPGGYVVPLGVIAEISLPVLRGLGMIARTELEAEEMKAIGHLGERLISRPFDYLAKQFDEAWLNAAPGAALEYLATKHVYSLHYSVPRNLEVPRQFRASEPVGATFKGSVREHLGSILDDQLLKLIDRVERTKHQGELLIFKAA